MQVIKVSAKTLGMEEVLLLAVRTVNMILIASFAQRVFSTRTTPIIMSSLSDHPAVAAIVAILQVGNRAVSAQSTKVCHPWTTVSVFWRGLTYN